MVLQLPDLSPLACLKKLDLSINQLRSMATLSPLQASTLKEVYITSNKVSTIEVWLSVIRFTSQTLFTDASKTQLVSMDTFAYASTVQDVLST
jgi:hypothetical protein